MLDRHGIGKMSSNGLLILTACSQHKLAITNTLFQQSRARKTTWMHPRSGHWHQIDFAMIRQCDINDVCLTRSMIPSTCFSDHRLLRITTAFSFKALQKRVRSPAPAKKLDVKRLSSSDELAIQFRQQCEEALGKINREGLSVDHHWNALRNALHSSAEKNSRFPEEKASQLV